MSRNRLMGVLLLTSWTLNVALGVALYYQSHAPHFGPPPFGNRQSKIRNQKSEISNPFPPEERELLRAGAGPLIGEQRRLARELFGTLTADTLDTSRVRRLSDSLGDVRCRMQGLVIDRVAAMHGRLTPEERENICARMVGRLGFEGPGRRHPNRGDK